MADGTRVSKLRSLEIPCTLAGVLIIILITVLLLPVHDPSSFHQVLCGSRHPGEEEEGHGNPGAGEEVCVQGTNDSDTNLTEYFYCTLNPCVRKCCKDHQRFVSTTNRTCVDHEMELSFGSVLSSHGIRNKGNSSIESLHVIHGIPCQSFAHPFISNDSWLFRNGRIISEDNETLTQSEYCFERPLGEDSIITLVCSYDGSDTVIVMWVKMLANLISFTFYVLTFLVYACFPALRVRFHGKSVMCHVFCMIVQALAFELSFLLIEFSIVFECIIFYAVLASFSWLSVICFDLWHNFRDMEVMRGPGGCSRSKRHLWYCVFAWGYPPLYLAITLTAAGIFPEIQRNAEVFLMFLPVELLLFMNLMMFVTTWCRLRQLGKGSAALERGGSRIHDANRKRYLLYVNLFLIMAAPWSMKMTELFKDYLDTLFLNIAVSVVVGFQGVLVFCVFVCNRKVFRLIQKRVSSSTS